MSKCGRIDFRVLHIINLCTSYNKGKPDLLNVLDCMDTMFGEYKFVIEISSGRIQNCRPGRLREMSLRCKLNARNARDTASSARRTLFGVVGVGTKCRMSNVETREKTLSSKLASPIRQTPCG